jgi:hypothetical protein
MEYRANQFLRGGNLYELAAIWMEKDSSVIAHSEAQDGIAVVSRTASVSTLPVGLFPSPRPG